MDGLVEPLAVGGASLLSSTTRADGFVIVGDDSEGFAAGADVEVWLYALSRSSSSRSSTGMKRSGASVPRSI